MQPVTQENLQADIYCACRMPFYLNQGHRNIIFHIKQVVIRLNKVGRSAETLRPALRSKAILCHLANCTYLRISFISSQM